MEKADLLTRIERRKKKQESQKAAHSTFKNILKGTAVFVISASLVSCTLNLPYIRAYFTDKIIYSESYKGEKALNSMGVGPVKLFFDIYCFNYLDVYLELMQKENILIAGIKLPPNCGFTESDIIIKSVKLSCRDGSAGAITPINAKLQVGELKIIFDWTEVLALIDDDDNNLGFDISGKGAGPGLSGFGEKFTFKGYGEITGLFSYTEKPVVSVAGSKIEASIPDAEEDEIDRVAMPEDVQPVEQADDAVPAPAPKGGQEGENSLDGLPTGEGATPGEGVESNELPSSPSDIAPGDKYVEEEAPEEGKHGGNEDGEDALAPEPEQVGEGEGTDTEGDFS